MPRKFGHLPTLACGFNCSQFGEAGNKLDACERIPLAASQISTWQFSGIKVLLFVGWAAAWSILASGMGQWPNTRCSSEEASQ